MNLKTLQVMVLYIIQNNFLNLVKFESFITYQLEKDILNYQF